MVVPEWFFVENLRNTRVAFVWRVRFSRILRELHALKRGDKAYGLVEVPGCGDERAFLTRATSRFLRASA